MVVYIGDTCFWGNFEGWELLNRIKKPGNKLITPSPVVPKVTD